MIVLGANEGVLPQEGDSDTILSNEEKLALLEKNMDKREASEKAGVHIPAFLIASVTSKCNLHCQGCYARARENSGCVDHEEESQLSDLEWLGIFEEAKTLGIGFVLIAGGEPFMKAEHPDAAVVCYVNTTTDIKAVSDYCVTSSNAVKVVQNVPEKEIIFIPDKNLGQYVAARVPEKTFHFFEGFCPTHHFIRPEEVLAMRQQEPDGEIMAHPECQPEVLALVDFVGSTGQMVQRAKDSPNNKIIVCTEKGILYRLKRDNPTKEFILLSPNLVCQNMKKINLDILLDSLKNMQYQIEVDEDMRQKAIVALDRMLAFS